LCTKNIHTYKRRSPLLRGSFRCGGRFVGETRVCDQGGERGEREAEEDEKRHHGEVEEEHLGVYPNLRPRVLKEADTATSHDGARSGEADPR